MEHVLPKLPFVDDALSPNISKETIEYHYGKHHKAYVDNINRLIQGTEWLDSSLEDIIKKAPPSGIFNNAAQVWNHTFYWKGLSPKGGEATGAAADALIKDFGTVKDFQEKFTNAAVTLFGSGWAWLVKNPDGKLTIEQTSNAANPLREGKKPLLVCDVWEHAYYIDYRNARAKYIENFWKIVNWDFVADNLK